MPTATSWPAARASASLSPSEPICGEQYVVRVTRRGSSGCGSRPAIASTATTPSWSALWASWKPPTTSPTALIPASPVRSNRSTVMTPRSTATPGALDADVLDVGGAADGDEQHLGL